MDGSPDIKRSLESSRRPFDHQTSGLGRASAPARLASRLSNVTRSASSEEPSSAARKPSAAARELQAKSHEPVAGGSGWSLSVAPTTTPSVPSEPTRSFGTSYPVTDLTTLAPP